MRVFMLTPYLPYPLLSGGQVRTYNLLKQISKKHEVTLFALIKDDKERQHINELKKYCHTIRVFRRPSRPWHPRNILLAGFTPYPFVVTRNLVMSLHGAIAAELKRRSYDLIHVETFYMMPSIPRTPIPVLLVEQTIEYLGYEQFARSVAKHIAPLRFLLNLDIKKIKYWERHFWRSCRQLVTVSQDDKAFIQNMEPTIKNIAVVSNGVDISHFQSMRKQLADHPIILFVGTFNWLPNVEAVEYLVDKVWPQIKRTVPGVELRIVGTAPTAKIRHYADLDAQIVVTGQVPDIRTEYAQANVLLAPVFSGKGTRYKVLEAMATQTPVVGTSIALEGLGATVERDYLEADTAVGLAEQTIRLLQDRDLQQRLAQAGERFVTAHYSWDHIATELLDVYERTAQ
jgi:glycosyltransferase involved in cell wall biosynthesis